MQQHIGQIKQSARVIISFICILSLWGCPGTQTQQDNNPHQVASAIMTQASEPLKSNNTADQEKEQDQKITQVSMNFVELLIKKDYKQAKSVLGPLLQKKYTDKKLEQNFQSILKQTGKNPKPVKQSVIIDKTMMSADKNSVADVYLSIKGNKGAKAMYLGLCNSKPAQIKICHIGWGTEDNGES
jgi:hypothetical protein